MGFNDQVQNLRGGRNRFSVFHEGVKTKWLTGQNGILFRILPAYNYEDKDGAGNINPAGWVPCRTPTGELTSWGMILRIARYVGHGNGKTGNRKDFMSPVTFTGDDKTFDPVAVLYQTAAMYPEWQYLVEDRREGGQNGKLIERAALSRASEFLAINIVELGGVNMPECVLGLCTKSTTDGLVNREKGGLVYQRANNMPDEMVAQNPMLQWALGDITDPNTGPVFFVMKGNDRGEFSGYQVGVATDQQQRVRKHVITPDLLAGRYDLARAINIAPKPDDAHTVQELVEIFNMRSPSMHHEHELLKLAFGDYFKIPDPPAAPAAAPMVGGGMPTQGQFQGAGFGPPPTAPGGFNPGGGFQKPAAGPAPQMQHAAQNAAAGPRAAPSAVPAEPPYDPALDPAPGAPPMAPAAAPAAPQAPPAAPAAPQAPAAPAAAPAAPQTPPAAPGDPVPEFSRQAFLDRLHSGRGPAPAGQG